jgi:hypothetical protein
MNCVRFKTCGIIYSYSNKGDYMDKYTENIKRKLLENNIIFNDKEYLKIKTQIDDAVHLKDIELYNKLINDLLDKLKEKKESAFLETLAGISLVFFTDYRTELILNLLGWILIMFGIINIFWNNSKEKKNQQIEILKVNPAKSSDLVKDVETKEKLTLKEKLQDLENLKDENIITIEEYKLKRKLIIDND